MSRSPDHPIPPPPLPTRFLPLPPSPPHICLGFPITATPRGVWDHGDPAPPPPGSSHSIPSGPRPRAVFAWMGRGHPRLAWTSEVLWHRHSCLALQPIGILRSPDVPINRSPDLAPCPLGAPIPIAVQIL